MRNVLIKFILLLSTFLSLHSALALPLSSVLANKYHALSNSKDLVEQVNLKTSLNEFADMQTSPSKLQASLLTLLQQEHNDSLVKLLFLAEIIALDSDVELLNAQTLSQQKYLAQHTIYKSIQGIQNSLYAQKSCYQAKLQRQQKTS